MSYNITPPIFVTGIGTDVGKTVVAAIITKALAAEYWKPIQAGDLDNSDSMKVARWIAPNRAHPEAFKLNTPASPHYAAAIDSVEIKFNAKQLPVTSAQLIIEGAGGIMVPINQNELLVDAIGVFTKTCIVVSRHYLGSINHTLLTIATLKSKGFNILGIVFNGDKNDATEEIIIKQTGVNHLGTIPWCEQINQSFIQEQALRLKDNLIHVVNQTA
jgi:dethiobiotin synthetase